MRVSVCYLRLSLIWTVLLPSVNVSIQLFVFQLKLVMTHAVVHQNNAM
jgi:hypothetical protein